jgi:hypothetical protein
MKCGSITAAAVLLSFSLAGCAAGSVRVKNARTDLGLKSKPDNCALEMLDRAPARAFEEIAELDTHVTSIPKGGAPEALRAKACELGADAVIVTLNFVTNEFGHTMVAGTAIKYVLTPPKAEQQDDRPARAPTDL